MFQKAAKYFFMENNLEMAGLSYLEEGKCYLKLNKLPQALEAFKTALTTFEDINISSIRKGKIFALVLSPDPNVWAVHRSQVEDQNPFIKFKKKTISSWIMECKWWNRRSPFQTKFKRLPRTITRIDFIVGTREKEY